MKREDVRGALARGYCSPENTGKEVDVVLCEAMADEIDAVAAAERDALEEALEALRPFSEAAEVIDEQGQLAPDTRSFSGLFTVGDLRKVCALLARLPKEPGNVD